MTPTRNLPDQRSRVNGSGERRRRTARPYRAIRPWPADVITAIIARSISGGAMPEAEDWPSYEPFGARYLLPD